MNKFDQSYVWQKTLGPKVGEDSFAKSREFLRVEYEKFRENARLVAAEIASDLPQFTVHDITHIDSLWALTDLIVPLDFDINPAEAFVLGGAFLIHDLGMGLAAYPEGLETLKRGTLWNDTVAYYYKKDLHREASIADLLQPEIKIEKKATENVLRLLHAKHAEELASLKWRAKGQEEQYYYLIDNIELRDSYSKIIGLIAHSHWWSVEDVAIKLSVKLGAPGVLPQEWTVDPIKIATILRIADAANVDDRRAPGFLRALRQLNYDSDQHWEFQQKLYQPRIEADRLIYTAKKPFTISENNSWWLCYDTLKLLDKELKEVDALLAETGRPRLAVIAVAGIEEPSRFANLIKVKDWHPVDTQIRVGDVAKLVIKLGGAELYGNDYTVPLRELIQNGADAIKARRILECESDNWGEIKISLGTDSIGQFIQFEDNGVGMSPKVLTGPFLDFGQSFWGSSLMHEELPGLESKPFKSTGKYGIGFYSIFMISHKISVISRRYEQGRENTWCLEFINGVQGRPILRKANADEVIKDGGTRIKAYLNDEQLNKIVNNTNHKRKNWNIRDVIGNLCISMDVDIIFQDADGEKQNLIKANDWKTVSGLELISRVIGRSRYDSLDEDYKEWLAYFAENMEIIKDDSDIIVGRCCLYTEPPNEQEYIDINAIVTVGGLKTDHVSCLCGVLIGENIRAARDKAVPIISDEHLAIWASSQAEKFGESNRIEGRRTLKLAYVVRRLGGNTSKLKVVRNKKEWIDYAQLVEQIKSVESEVIILEIYEIPSLESSIGSEIKTLDNVYESDSSGHFIHRLEDGDEDTTWPPKMGFNSWGYSCLSGIIIDAISEAWQVDIDQLIQVYEDERAYHQRCIIGYVDDKPITETGTVIKRANFPSSSA